MDGHADNAPDSGGLADLASFLTDTPEEESNTEAAGETDETTLTEDTDEPEQDDQSDDDDSDEESTDQPATDRKIAVTLKGDDGKEETLEVSEDELVKGYHRQADYTRKMQALAQRENEAVQLLTNKHEEVRNHYLQQTQVAYQAMAQMAGLRSDQEMYEMSRTDPAGYVEEVERQKAINRLLGGIQQQMTATQQQAMTEAQQREEQRKQYEFNHAWQVLQAEKIDKPKLANIYQSVVKHYGIGPDRLSNVYDPAVVLMMRDAAAYRELKSKAPQVTQKAQDAPRMTNKTSVPANERKAKQLNDRFKGGKAKLADLAQLLR
jgi:hypothetical protein